jgi:ComEC/Rec2-related protein
VTGIAIGAACVAGFAFGSSGVMVVALGSLVLRIAGKARGVWSLAIIVAAVVGAFRAVPAPTVLGPAWIDEVDAIRGVVASGPMSTVRGQRFNLDATAVRLPIGWLDSDALVCVSSADLPELRRGDRVFLVASVERIVDLPEGAAKAASARGCTATATAWLTTRMGTGGGWQHAIDGMRRSVATRLQTAAPGDSGALLAGLVTGDDGAMSDDAREAFVATGTTHITAVSGSNIALVVVSAVAIGGRFGFHRRFVWQMATAGGVWFYALLVGLEPPSLRAAIVASGAVFAVTFGRRADLVTLTTLAAALQLLYRPSDYWTLSFRLSFASALALALVLRGMSTGGIGDVLRSALVATTAAQVATAPVLITTFGQISPLSLPTNLIIAPFVAMSFPIAFVAALLGLASETLGEAVAAPGAVCAAVVLRVVGSISDLGGAKMTVGSPGLVGNIFVAATCIMIVGMLSVDSRRATMRWWIWARNAPRSTMILGVLTCAGFAIGLVLGAMR